MNDSAVLDAPFSVRPIAAHDLDIICHHRRAMFTEMGFDAAAIEASVLAFRPWLAEALAQNRYFGFVVESGGTVVAGIGLMRLPWPPHAFHPHEPERGYILNLYVEAKARHNGLAKHLMRLAEEDFTRRGLHYLVLHASSQGRPVYEQIGWRASTEMVKIL
jgi:ribosomal protein S18 acetylase RimI-like enzyme